MGALIHVCALAHVETTLRSSGARSVVSLLGLAHRLPALPDAIERRLHIAVSDITAPTPNHTLAEAADIGSLLGFVGAWDRRHSLLIHCYAGVSRSTAAAFVALCALDPGQSEAAHARRLRSASPTATPNARLVALADAALERQGRMIEAIAAIGRGADCSEGAAFTLAVRDGGEADAYPGEMG